MSNITALYFHEDDYLGAENLAETYRSAPSKSFLCESCGKVYGKRVITVLGSTNPYTTWGGLCRFCSPVGQMWRGLFSHSISGGFPFFHHYVNPPEAVIRHQFEMELITHGHIIHSLIPAIYPSGSERPFNGTFRDWQNTLHRNLG